MATLSAGYSFGATETVTNAKLASLVNSGSISGITQTDLAAGEGLVKYATSAPSDQDQIWVDTNSVPIVLRFYSSTLSAWVPAGELALYTNKSAQTGASGRVLILDTSNSNSYTYTSTAGDSKFLGIETGSIAANASAPVITRGSTIVNLEISASAGCYLRTSTATGKAEPCVNTSSGVFGFLTESGTASARSNIFGIDVNGAADQTANYSWTGTHSFTNTITINTASATTVNWSPLVQAVYTRTSAYASGNTAIPLDNTPPTSSEGTEVMTKAITPKHVNNILKITVVVVAAPSAGATMTLALFQDATANSIAAVASQHPGTDPQTITLVHTMLAGTTSATTFKVRIGSEGGQTYYFNGESSGNQLFGGVCSSTINIEEIKG